MLICHCKAVHDRSIREAIERGARDEFAVAHACGAGTGCGGCVPAVTRLLQECLGCPLATAEPQPAAALV
ncbi:MAG TPA: (2Fe-2S)-binding protein [Egibacteraceae bacterium]|nr:(2Fe-2S)-binding protein [Actinomycetota bacterium]HWB71391.1 (2Fe-2S)-binding protein [Egibacteraceae bacterium]